MSLPDIFDYGQLSGKSNPGASDSGEVKGEKAAGNQFIMKGTSNELIGENNVAGRRRRGGNR
jgi:hypothetical protein